MSSLINIPKSEFLDPTSATGVSQSWMQFLRDLASGSEGTIPTGQPGSVLGYTTGGALAPSLPLTQFELVMGGGTVPPSTVPSLGTAVTVLHGNATGAPSFGPVNLATDVSGVLPIANGGSGGGVKIVVMGDSLSAQNFTLHDAWPAVFQRTMNAADAPCTVVNLAIDGCSFYRALQPSGYSGPSNYVFGTNTMVQEAIAQNPALVLVMLGFNDTITDVDSRTLTQVESDATLTFAALRAGLPTAKIVYVSELPYDNVNFTVTASTCNVQTMGVVPYLFQFNATGITAGAYCTEALTNVVSAGSKTLLQNWFSLDATIKALNSAAGMDAWFVMWYWRVARLGTLGPDMLHPTAAGSILEQGYIMKGIAGLSFVASLFPKLMNQNYAVWNDPDIYFTDMLFVTGSGYYYNSDGGVDDEWIQQAGSRFQIFPFDDSWFLPYHTRCTLSPRALLSVGPPETFQTQVTLDSTSMFNWAIEHGPPFAGVEISVDGGAFAQLGNAVSYEGWAIGIGSGFSTALTAGTHTIRYLCITGNAAIEIYGPFTFVVSATANGGKFTTLALTGQLTSTLASGTEPLAVTSTTVCTNLNANWCNGFTFAGGASGSATATPVLNTKPGSNSSGIWAQLNVLGGGSGPYYFQVYT